MSQLISLKTLFTNSIFRIPDYQRWYSWRDLQLEELRSDVINLLPNKEHYTWMLSLKKLDEEYIKNRDEERWLIEDRWFDAFHIVDWQQRLTTFIILINEIVNYYVKKNPNTPLDQIFINSTPLSAIKEEYLVIRKPDAQDVIKTYKFWYEKDNPSFEFFKTRILNSEVAWHLEETFYTLNLENAKKFFAKKIEELASTKWLSAVEELFKKLTLKLVFNMYYIDDDFNVFIAFETMNNRWKRLSNLELLKNRLIYLSTLFDTNNYTQEVLRKNINDTWKTVYGFLWKNKLSPLNDDEFLQNHWMIYFWYSRQKVTYSSFLLNDYFTQQNIFNEPPLDNDEEVVSSDSDLEDSELDENEWSNDEQITEIWLKDKNSKLEMKHIQLYIDSMKKLINSWYLIHHPEEIENKSIRINLERLNRLWFVNFKPLATVLLSDDKISDDDKAECFKLMERYVFLHYRLNSYFQTFKNSFFFNLAHQYYYWKKNLDDIKRELNAIDMLSDNKVANLSWVFTKFERLFKNYNGYYSWANIRYFLYEYERYLTESIWSVVKILPEDLFKKDEKDKISIEHIYPQTPDDESWITSFSWYNDDEKKKLTNSLWNLLPLSQSINSSLQNYSFEIKKKKDAIKWRRWYEDWSHCEIEVSKYDKWTPYEILERWLKMISFMEKRWNFVIWNKYDKIKLLWLEFMANEEDKEIDVVEPVNEEKEVNSAKKEYLQEQFDRITNIANDYVLDYFKIFNMHCMELDGVGKYTTENYVAYTVNKKIIFRIWFNKDSFSIYALNWEYEDPLKKFFPWWSWRNTDVKMFVRDNNDLNYAVNKLLPQTYAFAAI